MFKYLFIPVIACLLFACKQKPAHKTLADSLHMADTSLKKLTPARIIVAGKSVGAIHINDDAAALVSKLGKPDSADAAMGASLMTWYQRYGKGKYPMSVYAHRNMGGADEAVKYIKAIRITSPWFKTADYSGPGSELKDIRKLYKLKHHIVPGTRVKNLLLYDDYNAGIGFEIDSTGRCTAVLVHAQGDSVLTYLNMH